MGCVLRRRLLQQGLNRPHAMVEIHTTYNKDRFEKLRGMFNEDPRFGNAALYVKEHFNLRGVCENCETRSTSKYLAAASLIAEGDSWVVPFSVTRTGAIVLDLESSIPDQSNFLRESIVNGLESLGILCNASGRLEYVVPICSSPDEYYHDRRKGRLRRRRREYDSLKQQFTCSVITDASPDDVLKWDTEVQYDFESYWRHKGESKGDLSTEIDYFCWLARCNRLVISRISDQDDTTLAIAYFVPGDYELSVVIGKRRVSAPYREYGLGNALLFMIVDHIYDKGLLTPLNLGSVLHQHKELWRPIPVVKPQLEFANSAVRLEVIERFGAD